MNEDQQLQDLGQIRTLMERSSRFISLSGLSGVGAGISALAGALAAASYLNVKIWEPTFTSFIEDRGTGYESLKTFLILDAFAVLIAGLGFGIFFTSRKAKKDNLPLWSPASRQMLFHLAVPLVAGGIFCLILFIKGYLILVAPSLLIFYGIALISASKYTFQDIRYLGFTEIILGCLALIWIGYGLMWWTIGFGIVHII